MRGVVVGLMLGVLVASATSLRVVTFNIETHRNQDGWPDYALGDPGTVDHDSVAAILARIDADVVALQEVHTSDLDGEVQQLAGTLGLPYLHAGSNTGNFDTSLRVVILSRFPFLMTESITSPMGAKEIARHCPAVVVDVPGTTADPLIISAHLKSGTATADRFRRAIEMRRLAAYLDASGFTETDNFIVLGDFNPSSSTTTFSALPSGLPGTYDLGDDVSLPVVYSPQMLSYFGSVTPSLLDPRQLGGDDGTYEFGQTLDLIFVSPALASRPHASEVYVSSTDVSMGGGLAKPGPLPAAGASAQASDHYAVFADFELDPDLGSLGLAASKTSMVEGDEDVLLTVTLPQVLASEVIVELSADEGGAVFEETELTIPAGGSSGSTTFTVPRDFVSGPARDFTFTAVAGGFDPATTLVTVVDRDGAYQLTGVDEPVIEAFEGFGGDHEAAPWLVTPGTGGVSAWRGMDAGALPLAGGRSYGAAGDGSLGVYGEAVAFEATVTNATGLPLTMLDVAYDAEQWRSAFNGAAAGMEVELVVEGAAIPLPALTHDARRDLPSGPVAGGDSTRYSTRVTGFNLPPDDSLKVRFRFTVDGEAIPASSEVWINEFHYDNEGADVDEFVEVVVGPGRGGDVSDLTLWLYNGADGGVYGSHPLSEFTQGETTSDGYSLFWKAISGIQNGSPDGLALTAGGTVEQFISYEGTFVATDGPAEGMVSASVGVSQSGHELERTSAIGMTGSGAEAADFTWEKTDGIPHSPGSLNHGQVMDASGRGFQGLAVDDIAITAVGDADLDGVADEDDADDDNDGQPDVYELAFGSDPFDPASAFDLRVEGDMLRFPGAEGILYVVEWCDDLSSWDHSAAVEGGGSEVEFPLPVGEERVFLRVRGGE